MEFDWVYLPNFIRGLLLLVLAITLIVVRPGHRLHQALAAFLALRGVMRMLSIIDGDVGTAVDNAFAYFLIGTALTGIWFGLLFWESHGASGGKRHGWTRWALLAAGALACIAYAGGDRSPARLFDWIHVLVPLMNLTLAGVGLLSLLIALRTPLGVHRRSLTLLGAAFLLEPAFRGVQLGGDIFDAYQRYGGEPLLFATFGYGATVACVLAGIALLATLLGRPLIAGVVAVAALSGFAPRLLGPLMVAEPWLVTLFTIHAVWTLISSSMLIYALLHSKVFELDLRLKATLRSGLPLAGVAALFIGALELAEALIPSLPIGVPLTVSSVIVLAALLPLHRISGALADRLMPRVTDSETYRRERALLLYQAALEDAAVDGRLTRGEKGSLVALQDRFEITSRDAVQVERRTLGQSIAEFRS